MPLIARQLHGEEKMRLSARKADRWIFREGASGIDYLKLDLGGVDVHAFGVDLAERPAVPASRGHL